MKPQQCNHIGERLNKKIIVFEKPQESQVCGNAEPKPEPPVVLIPSIGHHQPGGEVKRRGENEEKKKTVVPRAVKEVAADQEQQVLDLDGFVEYEPIEKKYYREKYGEPNGVEEHAAGLKSGK
jgi:hypothetical protein